MHGIKLSTVIVTIALAACSAPQYRNQPPAPVIKRGEAASAPPTASTYPEVGPGESDAPSVTAYIPPAGPQIARPAPAKAVQMLVHRAEDQRSTGDLPAAVSSLERALHIEPRNADLWHRLAVLREAQGRYAMAEELAGKSNSLAGLYESALKRDNWELIARSRRAQGKSTAARDAERQASRFE